MQQLAAPLTDTEQEFALLLAEGTKISEAGERVGVSTATAYRWVKNPAILEIVAAAQKEVRQDGVRRLFGLMDKAIRAYEDALDGKDVLATRKASADAVLDRIGLSKEQIIKHVGDADQPITFEFKVPFNPDARAEQEERRRRRAEAQAVEGTYHVIES
jgi:hypothetical protein